MMRRVAFLVVAIVAALVVAALLVPLDAFRGPLETAASRALQREVKIAGHLHFAVFPRLGISLKDVSIANPPGDREKTMVAVGKIVVDAALMPLLHGHLHVTRLVLKKPVIHLEVPGKGAANPPPGGGNAPLQATAGPVDISFERVTIEDGEITYADPSRGQSATLSAVSLELAATSVASGPRALTLAGTATYRGVSVKLDAGIADIAAFLAGKASPTKLALSAPLATATFDGSLQAPGLFAGKLVLDAKSLRDLAAWLGAPLPPGNGLGAIALQAAVSAKDGVYTLSRADIALDGMKISGDIALDSRPAVPALKGTLAVDHIDIAPYLAPGAAQDVKAAARPGRDQPLALGGLKAVDAELTLSSGEIKVPDVTLDKASLVVSLHGGVLNAALNEIAAYGGSGKGTLTVDATGATPTFHQVLDMAGLRAERFLGEVMGISGVTSSGSVRLDITARGSSENAIVRSLAGRSTIAFGPGRISGVDLGLVARLLQSTAGLLTGATGGGAKTDFTALSASFTLQDGVARTTDLRMSTPSLAITGAGSIDLASRRIDFHLDPKAPLGVAGVNLFDLGVPFHVTGPLDNPSFAAEPVGFAKGLVEQGVQLPAKALGVPGKLLSVPGNALKSLFGN